MTGTVNLDSDSMGGATLSLVFLSTPGVGDVLTLIDNDGSDAVVGTFLGLAEGSTITFGAADLHPQLRRRRRQRRGPHDHRRHLHLERGQRRRP